MIPRSEFVLSTLLKMNVPHTLTFVTIVTVPKAYLGCRQKHRGKRTPLLLRQTHSHSRTFWFPNLPLAWRFGRHHGNKNRILRTNLKPCWSQRSVIFRKTSCRLESSSTVMLYSIGLDIAYSVQVDHRRTTAAHSGRSRLCSRNYITASLQM